MEYTLRNKIIEVLCAYAMVDKPPGFFRFALEILSDIISSVRATSLLSHSSVHPGISYLLRGICRNLSNWKFKDSKPDYQQI